MEKLTNILLAEDDGTDYDFFIEALEEINAGLEVTWVKTGLDCMAILKTDQKFDAIFLDLNMPAYNGIDCLRYIKGNENRADIPVVIFSTSHYIKNIDTCFKMGAHYYIVKPVEHRILVSSLKQVLNQLSATFERPAKHQFVVGVSTPVEG